MTRPENPPGHPDRPTLGVILAGGEARRLGGLAKGLIPLAGRPLVCHVAATLARVTGQVVVSANDRLDAYRDLGFPVVSDSLGSGPLAGVVAVMRTYPGTDLLIAPCDTPLLPPDYGERLLAALSAGNGCAVARQGKQTHFACLALASQHLEAASAYLERGERRLGGWLQTLRPTLVAFDPGTEAFLNINTQADLSHATKLLQ